MIRVGISLPLFVRALQLTSSDPSVQSNSPSQIKNRGIHSCSLWVHWKCVSLLEQGPIENSTGLEMGSGGTYPPPLNGVLESQWFDKVLRKNIANAKFTKPNYYMMANDTDYEYLDVRKTMWEKIEPTILQVELGFDGVSGMKNIYHFQLLIGCIVSDLRVGINKRRHHLIWRFVFSKGHRTAGLGSKVVRLAFPNTWVHCRSTDSTNPHLIHTLREFLPSGPNCKIHLRQKNCNFNFQWPLIKAIYKYLWHLLLTNTSAVAWEVPIELDAVHT